MIQVGQWRALSSCNKEQVDGLLSIVLSSRAPSTVIKYQGAFTRWKSFAASKHAPCLPADSLLFASYLEQLAKATRSVSAVEEAYNSVNWVHDIAGLQSLAGDAIVKSVVEGVRRLFAKPVVKKEPVTVEDLRAIVENSDLTDLGDVRTAALCLLCFAAFLRFDELAGLHCSDVIFADGHLKLRIRKSKTDQYRQGDEVVLTESESPTCPVGMLKRYMALGEVDRSSEAALFRPITRSRSGVTLRRQGSLSYTRARELVKEALKKAGRDPDKYGLHSLRSGGATAAANAGVPDRAFKRHGRWRSENAKDGYVKDTLEYRLNVSKSLGL